MSYLSSVRHLEEKKRKKKKIYSDFHYNNNLMGRQK